MPSRMAYAIQKIERVTDAPPPYRGCCMSAPRQRLTLSTAGAKSFAFAWFWNEQPSAYLYGTSIRDTRLD